MKNTPKVSLKLWIKGFFISLARNRLIAGLFPFKQPSILLLSYPRSGSSWLGMILATSDGVAYLREPVTQPYMGKYHGKFALLQLDQDRQVFPIYHMLAEDAFQGRPPVYPYVVNRLSDFHITRRKSRQVLVKEVNPHAVKFYVENFHPKVILLIRHPAAVALSFHQLGWLESTDVQMDHEKGLSNAWQKFAYTYGTVLQNTLEYLKEKQNFEVAIYEAFASDPHNEFIRLFQTLGIKPPINYDEVINKYCFSSKESNHKGEVMRTSMNMIDKWKSELTEEQVADIKHGFCESRLEYYRNASDWLIAKESI